MFVGINRAWIAILAIFISLLFHLFQTPSVYAGGNIGGSTCNQADFQTAINSGGVVNFTQDCTINVGAPVTINTSVTINGNGFNVVLDGGGADRVLNITGGNIQINDLTVTNGQMTSGDGGGINHASSGTLTLNNVTVTGNSTTGFYCGGGIGMEFSVGLLTINNSLITGNHAAYCGGGIEGANSTTIRINNSTISNNTAGPDSSGFKGHGGGIFGSSSTNLTVINSTISGNGDANMSDGGGLRVVGPTVISNTTISDNTATRRGAGLVTSGGGNVTFYHSTIANNLNDNSDGGTEPGGGGLYSRGSAVITLRNTIVAGNRFNTGAAGLTNAAADCDGTGTITDGSGNLVGTGTGCPGSNTVTPADIPSNAHSVLAPLANNGGPGQTHALKTTSGAAINRIAVGSNGCATTVTTDQRGVPRPQYSTAPPNGGCDIGAYEVGAVEVNPFDLTLSEPNGSAPVTLTLTTNPGTDVIVNLSSANPDECTVSPTSVTLNDGNLSDPVTVTALPDFTADGDQICTIVTAPLSSSNLDFNGSNPIDVRVLVQDDGSSTPPIDLQISKSDGGTAVNAGETVAYTLTYTNTGAQSAADVVITETIPANTTFNAGASTAGWSCTPDASSGSTCTLAIGAVAGSGGNGSRIFAVTVANPLPGGVTQVSNTASIGDDGTNGADASPGDNSDSDTTPVSPAPDLQLAKDDGGITVVPGGTVTYTLTYSNVSSRAASGVVITETVPTNTTFNAGASSVGWSCVPDAIAGSTCTLAIGAVAGDSNSTRTFAVDVDSPLAGGVTQITNTVQIGDDGSNGADPAPGDNSASDTTPVNTSPDLQISKTDGSATAIPGTAITYTIVVSNAGPTDIVGATVNDTFTASLTGITWTCNAQTGASCTASGSGNLNDTVNIPQSGRITYTVLATIASNATGSLVNTANITASGISDPVPANNSSTDSTTLTPQADLTLQKSDAPDPVSPNNPLTYTLTVTNNGPSDAQGVVVNDTLPVSVTFVSTTGCAEDPNGVPTCTLGTIAAGSSAQYVIQTTVASDSLGSLVNNASVSASTPLVNTGDDSVTQTTTITTTADIELSKTASNLTPVEGELITYTLMITNNGPDIARSVVVSDVLPLSSVTYVATASNVAGGIYTFPDGDWDIGDMTPGQVATLNLGVQINANTAGQTITNAAVISQTNTADPNSANNSAVAPIQVQGADLELSKMVNNATPVEGEAITYTLTITNHGPFSATNIVISDVLPSGLNDTNIMTAASSGIAAYNSGSRTFTWNGDLPASGSAIATYSLIVESGTNGQFITNTAIIQEAGITDPNVGNNNASASIAVGSAGSTIYLPIVLKNVVNAPDLVVTSLQASSNALTVTIRNDGSAPVSDAFWVDLYIDPNPAPTAPNQIWSDLSNQGIAWGIEGTGLPLDPVESLTLTVGDIFYKGPPTSTVTFPIAPNTPIYAQVDSADTSNPQNTGAVLESHEISGGPYNNISSTLSTAATSATTPDSQPQPQLEETGPAPLLEGPATTPASDPPQPPVTVKRTPPGGLPPR